MNTKFSNGEPYWVDTSAPDVPAAAQFYQQLFGWQGQDLGAEAGHYTIMTHDDAQVAAIGPAEPGQQPWWTPYFKVADAQATTAAVEAAGGTVILRPMDVMGQLTMAVYSAPDEAIFAVGQPVAHPGLQKWDEVGAVCGLTLLAEDDAAFDFYRQVFGWRSQDGPMGPTLYAAEASRSFGNMHVMDPVQRPPGARPSWTVIFKVADVDAVAQAAEKLGATVPVGPMDLPGVGRTAFILDGNGAGFSIAAEA